MTSETFLLDRYGPLVTVPQLAEILHRSANGLRISLSSNDEFARFARQYRRKIGRRVYYETTLVNLLVNPPVAHE